MNVNQQICDHHVKYIIQIVFYMNMCDLFSSHQRGTVQQKYNQNVKMSMKHVQGL